MKVAYCTGFWSTNLGNGFFSLGVEYALKKLLGTENVTVLSDFQTYTTSYGKRLYPDKNQLDFISALDIDYVVLSGPMLSRYFVQLWKDVIINLHKRGVRYILLSAGIMKLENSKKDELYNFLKEYPPYILISRDEDTYYEFSRFADHAYNGICFSFFVPDLYNPCKTPDLEPYVIYNFDKINEPDIWIKGTKKKKADIDFTFLKNKFCVRHSPVTRLAFKSDRFTDALIYALSALPKTTKPNRIGEYTVIRTDHRFHPHFRRKIYRYSNSYCADLPYGYLNLYANATFTLSDRVHACAVTLAFGNSAMLFSATPRSGLLDRVGATQVRTKLEKLDLAYLNNEKSLMLNWLGNKLELGSTR